EVRDQGRGIPKDKLEAIFEKFYQVQAGNRREDGGSGLGLTISRGIVRQHGGRIWAESVPGEGSRFYISLPIATGEPREIPSRKKLSPR
ncbi:MAG: cell wall metabolism sensor histidine kinase WalK, partial [Cyanobacteria bacterium REEB65]|nr:cell wall metabolism sensor histidine kinase WalK [Cyanobacteria bacterium REEB65]